MSKPISGVITALVTPFYKGKVDYDSLKKLVKHQLDHNIDGFVVNGTTAESPTLHSDEVEKIFKVVAKASDRAVPLILGTGSNSTEETIKKTKLVKKLKADAALIVVPYYNKPPQRGLVAHYKAVAKQTKAPILLYNVPGRTVVSLTSESILELAKVKNIIGVKEASGKTELVERLRSGTPKTFTLLSGDDTTCVEFMMRGGDGVISVISHIIPNELSLLSHRAIARQKVAAEYARFDKLNQLMGIEANPMPVKMGLHLMGILRSPELRLPMLTLSPENELILQHELKQLGII